VTLVGEHETVIVGVAVVEVAPLPQEFNTAGKMISAADKRRRRPRTRSCLQQKFGSDTRNPPARTTLIS
jgi:hypothetical protein